MKKLYVIAGKACAGKDTLVKRVMERLDVQMAVSFTTRPKRTGETNGVEYNFIKEKELVKLIKENKIAEYTEYNVASGDTWYYGLTKEELEKEDFVIVIVNPAGVEQLKKIYGDKIKVIYITADDKTRIKRYLDRDSGNNVAECCRRYLADEKDFKDFTYDLKVDNEYLDISTALLYNFIRNDIGATVLKEMNEEFKNNPCGFIGDNND